MDGHQVFHAEAAVGRVEVGGIEHLIAQIAQAQMSREVAVERLGSELVFSYLFHIVIARSDSDEAIHLMLFRESLRVAPFII